MKQRFILYRRGRRFYCEDTVTRKQESLRTNDRAEALTLLHSKNESFRQPALNVQIAKVYLSASDSGITTRTGSTLWMPSSKPNRAQHRNAGSVPQEKVPWTI